MFDTSTTRAIEEFQSQRGLHVNGHCDEATWLALAEAGWTLGDRLLLLGAPHLRGDDVAELQAALNHLGFDCGRPDGIMGPATARALGDFQRNSGLAADGVCGAQTVQMLGLVARQSGTGPGVAAVRELSSLAGSGSLHSLRIVIGQFGGLSAISRVLARTLREAGATVISTDEYEAGAHAAAANRFGAAVYVGFEAVPTTRSVISYFAVPAFESLGGRTLATLIVERFTGVLTSDPELRGMRLPVLRETRMPAVLCTLGPVREVVDTAEAITSLIVDALSTWVASPVATADL